MPSFFAAFFFYRAGIHYALFKTKIVEKVEEALEKVSVYHIDLHNESIANLMKMDLRGLTPNSFREGE